MAPINLDYNCKANFENISDCDITIMKNNRNHDSNVWLFCDKSDSPGNFFSNNTQGYSEIILIMASYQAIRMKILIYYTVRCETNRVISRLIVV